MVIEDSASPVGTEVLEVVRAEDEPWLADCFVPPEKFNRMGSDRSVVVFGRPGEGKSALCCMLEQAAREQQCLPVRWYPHLATPAATEGDSLARQVQEVLELCLISLLEYLGRAHSPENIPSWAIRLLRWLSHRFVRGDLSIRLGSLLGDDLAPTQRGLLNQIISPPQKELFPAYDYRLILAEFSKLLPCIALNAIWILTDVAEADLVTSDWLDAMDRFLQALPLFEKSRLVYKLFFPSRFRGLAALSVLDRRRADRFPLHWKPTELREIVERRLALATGDPSIRLEDLCSANDWLLWLEKVGGAIPREWLIQVRPILKCFLSQCGPVDRDTWVERRLDYPPSLYLDEKQGFLRIGGSEISLSHVYGREYALLRYLYDHPNQVIPRSELYYRALKGMKVVPRGPTDEGYEGPAEYRGILDSLIWRLRQTIEPDPDHPMLLRTVRGHGVQLVVRRIR